MVYPFCTYNSGPCFREKIEQQFSVPFDLNAAKQNGKGDGLTDISWKCSRATAPLKRPTGASLRQAGHDAPCPFGVREFAPRFCEMTTRRSQTCLGPPCEPAAPPTRLAQTPRSAPPSQFRLASPAPQR
jgi:hypothetical protein